LREGIGGGGAGDRFVEEGGRTNLQRWTTSVERTCARAGLLLATGRRRLIEGNIWGDRYWGACQDEDGQWVGENRLGELLMEVRRDLAEREALHA